MYTGNNCLLRCFLSERELFKKVFVFQTEAAQFDVTWKVPAIIYYAKRNYHSKYDLRSKIYVFHFRFS